MQFLRTTTATIVACLLLLPACGPQYKKAQLKPLDTKTASYQETKNGITLNAKVLCPQETRTVFGSKGRYLEKSGIIPVQISIANNSSETLQFDPTKINAPFADSKKVASALSSNPSRTASGIVVVGTFAFLLTGLFGGVAILAYAFSGGTSQIICLLFLLPAAGTLILTPTYSVYYYKKINSSNTAVQRDIKSMLHAVSIAPNQTLDTVLFLDKAQFNGTLSLSLNAPLSSTTFTIDLQK